MRTFQIKCELIISMTIRRLQLSATVGAIVTDVVIWDVMNPM